MNARIIRPVSGDVDDGAHRDSASIIAGFVECNRRVETCHRWIAIGVTCTILKTLGIPTRPIDEALITPDSPLRILTSVNDTAVYFEAEAQQK